MMNMDNLQAIADSGPTAIALWCSRHFGTAHPLAPEPKRRAKTKKSRKHPRDHAWYVAQREKERVAAEEAARVQRTAQRAKVRALLRSCLALARRSGRAPRRVRVVRVSVGRSSDPPPPEPPPPHRRRRGGPEGAPGELSLPVPPRPAAPAQAPTMAVQS